MVNVTEYIKESKLIAILRGLKSSEEVIEVAKALNEGGIKAIEVTADTPNFIQVLTDLCNELGDQVLIGAGTILDAETARLAIMAGAKFIISPHLNLDVIKVSKRYGVTSMPGALTPTEIVTAYEHGADFVKVFPSSALGPGYIKDLRGPLSHIPLIPTGGISLNNIDEYLKIGVAAVGLGSSLVNTKNINLAEITENAKQLVEKVKGTL